MEDTKKRYRICRGPWTHVRLPAQVLCKLDLLVKKWVRGISAKKGYTEPTLSDVRTLSRDAPDRIEESRLLPCLGLGAFFRS